MRGGKLLLTKMQIHQYHQYQHTKRCMYFLSEAPANTHCEINVSFMKLHEHLKTNITKWSILPQSLDKIQIHV